MYRRISVKEHDFEISVSSMHTLDDDKTEISLPRLLDSQHISNVQFSFSGTVDHSTSILPGDMLRSSVVQCFHHYLIINGEHLGIINISEVTLDDGSFGASAIPKVLVTPTSCASFCTSLHAHILSIHLAYNWKPLGQLSSGLSIFSPQTLLPLQPALNKLMQKLFSVDIVGRHPWLFGPLRTKLHLERQWFPSLVRSLLAITDRSGNLIFRNKAQALVKAEKIENHVSVYKQVIGTNNSRPSSPSSRTCPSDSLAPDIHETLVSALEVVLKIATRPPPFKGTLHMASTQPSSNDETSNLSGLHGLSENFAGDTFWNDLLPTSPCLSSDPLTQQLDDNLWSDDSEEMVLDSSNTDSACQLPSSKISLVGQSIWDSVDEEDGGLTSRDVSPPLTSEPYTGAEVKSELRCPSAHESFIALDHNMDVPPDPCIFDDDGDGDVVLLAFD